MLDLRPACEHCNKALHPASLEARICSYECTFCAQCAHHIEPGGGVWGSPRLPIVRHGGTLLRTRRCKLFVRG